MIARFRPLALVACALLSGCLVGPNYRRPAASTPAAYKEAAGWAPAQPSDAADKQDWWTAFGDPVLDDLEARVARSNQTLAAAEAAYRQARALVTEDRAALFPTLSLTGSANRSGGGGSGVIITGGGTGVGTTTGGGASTSYRLGLGGTWEPDLWGAVRRNIESARASAEGSAATLANTRLSAQMELAADYILVRQYDEQKRILDATAVAYQRSVTVTANRYRAGVVAKGDLLSAQSLLDGTRASEIDLEQQRARAEHAIAILAGQAPATLALPPGPWTLTTPQIPAGVPAALLQRRPDIAAAARAVAAASALIGVQTAAYYPTLTLTGEGDLSAGNLGRLFNASSGLWSVGASAAQTIFDAGARRARVAQARAAYDQSVANYRQTVLTAFGQVEDNLAAQRVLAAELGPRRSAAANAQAAETIARNQYLAGLADYTAVAVAQANALSARTAQVQVEAAQLTAAVDLIAALGGGWRAPAP